MVMLKGWSLLQVSREEQEQGGEHRGVVHREARAGLFVSVHLFMVPGQNLVIRLHVTGGAGEYGPAPDPA